MKHTLALFAILGCISIATHTAAAETGSLYRFLRNDASARASAMAGVFVAMPEDPSSVFYNPATVMTVQNSSLGTTFLKHVLDINSGFVSYTDTLNEFGNGGKYTVGVNYVNYGSFDERDSDGEVRGTFGGYDIALQASYANALDEKIYYGVSVKFVNNSLEEVGSSAVAFDVGLLARFNGDSTNVGISVLHAGTQLSKLDGISESLPVDVRIGVNHRLRGLPLLVNLSLSRLSDEAEDFFNRLENFAVAGELYLSKALQVRLGYDNQRRRELAPSSQKKLSGFSAGLGINVKNAKVDYGISSFGIAGAQHRFTVNLIL